ncbi:pali-domain-containing protein [Armillaria mellea]|nr:pali-domain-containing protein [Armillaria mellea]
MLASITPFVSLSAFVLLLVSLSVPIIKSLFLFRLTADAKNLYGVADANGSATFGVWGYCVSALDISDKSNQNVEQYADLINKGSAAALVLHPIDKPLRYSCAIPFAAIAFFLIRHRVNDETDGQLQLTWGNAVWMVLGATVALWFGIIGSCCGICACGRHRQKGGRY